MRNEQAIIQVKYTNNRIHNDGSLPPKTYSVNSTFALENRNIDLKLASEAVKQLLTNPYQLDTDAENVVGLRDTDTDNFLIYTHTGSI